MQKEKTPVGKLVFLTGVCFIHRIHFQKPIKPRQRSGATHRSGTFAAKMADLQGFDGGRSPNEPERSDGNLQIVSNPVFAAKRKNDAQKEKTPAGKQRLPGRSLLFARITHEHIRTKRQKKWQTYKDSNLDKVNQNHLCYRYTIGLRYGI